MTLRSAADRDAARSAATVFGAPWHNPLQCAPLTHPCTLSDPQGPSQIAIPKKRTEEVDWTGPIRSIISQSYGESPDSYATECAALQRTRQDAVRGAGSDFTARDLLYKYFGQLELLELRFSEIKVSFPWCVVAFESILLIRKVTQGRRFHQ